MNTRPSTGFVVSLLFLLVFTLLMPACGSDSEESENNGPDESLMGQEVILSGTIQSDVLPAAVTHYGAGQYATLSQLELSTTSSTATGTVKFQRHGESQQAFSLVVHVVTLDRWLGIHFQPDQRLILIEPSPSQGNVLFSLEGYTLDEKEGKGTITFTFPLDTPGMFDLGGNTGTVFVYLVTPPEDGSATLDAVISNVLEEEIEL